MNKQKSYFLEAIPKIVDKLSKKTWQVNQTEGFKKKVEVHTNNKDDGSLVIEKVNKLSNDNEKNQKELYKVDFIMPKGKGKLKMFFEEDIKGNVQLSEATIKGIDKNLSKKLLKYEKLILKSVKEQKRDSKRENS